MTRKLVIMMSRMDFLFTNKVEQSCKIAYVIRAFNELDCSVCIDEMVLAFSFLQVKSPYSPFGLFHELVKNKDHA